MAGTDPPRCRCKQNVADRYAARVSGPLRDRIDLWVAMPRVPPSLLGEVERPEGSAVVAGRIAAARERQAARSGRLNARIAGRALRAVCGLDRSGEARIVELAEAGELSARAAERLLRVARTIADLAGTDRVGAAALDEAARYRDPSLSLSRQGAA